MIQRKLQISTLAFAMGLSASAQAPMLQDGAAALRQARLDWTLGQTPLPPSSLPSFEVGWGGANSQGAYTPLIAGEGLGQGSQGWGVGLQGRYVRGGWSFAATMLGLRDRGRTLGFLQRFAVAYQTESGWRAALEQSPFAWGVGLNGGDLMGDAARPFPRFSLSTPELSLPLGRWRAEAFLGRLEDHRPIPDWIPDREARLAARAAGSDLERPKLWGGLLRASFGPLVEASFGAVTMEGGRDVRGQTAPGAAARTLSLVEIRARIPALAKFARAQGASLYLSHRAAPENASITLTPFRHLGGFQLVWEAWDLGGEYAKGCVAASAVTTLYPSHLAGFSTHGDPLGSAFGPDITTRTLELGLPLFLEGRGRLKAMRATALAGHPSGAGSWFLQADVQWRTSTGRLGASTASRRDERQGGARWGWTFSVFQAFRIF